MNKVKLVNDRERAVTESWRAGHLRPGTMQIYLYWVRRFRVFCARRGLDDVQQLTEEGVRRFVRLYTGPRLGSRRSAPSSKGVAPNALHAWSCGLRALGVATPPWQTKTEVAPLPPLLEEFRRYREAHCGVSAASLRRDIDTASAFLALLRRRRRSLGKIGLTDVDVFVSQAAARYSRSTVADTCSSLRAFLRFLHATERLVCDLAVRLMRPRFRLSQRPRGHWRGAMCSGS
jgi:site-specific recombinase XerD